MDGQAFSNSPISEVVPQSAGSELRNAVQIFARTGCCGSAYSGSVANSGNDFRLTAVLVATENDMPDPREPVEKPPVPPDVPAEPPIDEPEPDRLPDEVPTPNPDETRNPPAYV
ncbi:hypothetical protein LH464_14165 [Neorhizobium sp. T786]|uniref:hypothetical protein n=1 Tax=Pseudorhizobium xiangyangii TaxID=2883104 RepID=UPI001CFFD28E|nr:hypothetical protein [Neorhizobium xiangyangii]MCB5203619.1 hypothetical protein [Neorhizobium xiangyangii]